MDVIYGETFPSLTQPVWLTLGTFDGVHQGHQHILRQLAYKAQQEQSLSIVLTFEPHPRKVLYPEDTRLKLLNTLEERLEELEKHHIDKVWVYPFTQEFSQWNATQFVTEVIVKQLKAKGVFIGYDHRFGKSREGGYELFEQLGAQFGFEVIEIPVHQVDAINVSSTKIRGALEQGHLQMANAYLSYPYRLQATVVKGNQLGRTIGFPTANLGHFSTDKIIPKNGVYAVKVKVRQQYYGGMMNIGTRPTVEKGNTQHLEVHLFDFNEDIYGETITVYWIDFLREEQKFPNVQILQTQLVQDRIQALSLLT